MATPIDSILIIATTSTAEFATSEAFSGVYKQGLFSIEYQLASTTPGGTKVVEFPANGSDTLESIQLSDIYITVEPPNEGDAWLPGAFFILGKANGGTYKPIAAISKWPQSIWLSADSGDHKSHPAVPQVSLQDVMNAL